MSLAENSSLYCTNDCLACLQYRVSAISRSLNPLRSCLCQRLFFFAWLILMRDEL